MPNNGVAYATDNTDTNFAWAVYGGLAYDVTPNFTVDLSYRYLDMGDAKSGRVRAFDNSTTNSGFFIDDITSQDVMLGVHYKFGGCCGPEPMPVASKLLFHYYPTDQLDRPSLRRAVFYAPLTAPLAQP